ncbi:sister chromatid cohesion 1 protein 1-like [Lolium perenne]|uniref:sister chromatid cohesion 1 protein 1-like n=1 Tax=Lolium perenne TaxID=4522 RepID=UPI0021F5C527|nr:sister chromatid cohesion 1 protein 1-like [Lolium perenne]
MALRLSGILMGGVVIVYQRKVKLLFDDVSRLLVEINQAWKIRPAVDRTVLPKGKSQAKYEAVTLPENVIDMEVEQRMLFTDSDTAKFRGMRLEDLDEQYFNVNLDDDNLSRAEHHHQAEPVNITLVDNFESGFAETDIFNRFERFDIADDDTTVHISPEEHPQAPSTLIPSPPRQEEPPQQQEQFHAAPSPFREEPQQGDSLNEQKERKLKGKQPARSSKRKARVPGPEVTVDTQTMISGNIYQTWLKDPSSLVSKRRRVSSETKIGDRMNLPPVGLMSCSENSPGFYYPKQLMQLWKECTETKSSKPSSSGEKTSSSQEQQPRNSPPQPQEEHQNEMGAQPMDFTDGIEKIRVNKTGEFENGFDSVHGDHSVTPGSPGLSHRSASSSGGSRRGGISSVGSRNTFATWKWKVQEEAAFIWKKLGKP